MCNVEQETKNEMGELTYNNDSQYMRDFYGASKFGVEIVTPQEF